MKNPPGYPLPSGELGSDDIVCQLVYLPDRQEYWQAFYASLHYMTTWRAWERDSDKRGQDAASNWREAFELTSGCWRMTCLEQLQDDVAEILAIMQLGNPCCDDMDITDGDQYTDRVEDGVGDVPQNIIDAGYAEDSSDWDGFDDYKCMIAHVTINQMSIKLNELNELTNQYGAIAGSAAAITAILAVIFGTGGLAIVFGIVAGVGAVSLLYEALMGFELLGDLADKVDANHDELACSIYWADGDEGALIALNDKIDELFTVPESVIVRLLNNGPTLKALYAGRYDQQDIAQILDDAGYDVGDFDCACDDPIGDYQAFCDFNSGYDSWVVRGTAYRMTFAGIDNTPMLRIPYVGAHIESSHNKMLGQAGGPTGGAGDSLSIHSFTFWYQMEGGGTMQARLIIRHAGGTFQQDWPYNAGSYVKAQVFFPTPLVVEYDDLDEDAFEIRPVPGSNNSLWIDNVGIDFDYNEA
ncbi:MAG: hypothetical protein V3V74_05740 [Nitrosomonadaceae bacterium]